MINIDKLNKIAESDHTWQKRAEKRKENRSWQKKAQIIAVKVLSALKKQKITQRQLAQKMGISPQQINKIVKGNENLTLQSIAKLEEALGIQLISFGNTLSDQKILSVIETSDYTEMYVNFKKAKVYKKEGVVFESVSFQANYNLIDSPDFVLKNNAYEC